MIANIWQFIKRHKWIYLLIFLSSLLASLLTIIPNYIIQQFIDGVVEGTLNGPRLTKLGLIFLAASILLFCMDSVWGTFLFSHSRRYEKETRLNLFRKLLELRSPFYEQFRSGEILTRMTSDIVFMGELVGYGFMVAVGDVLWVVSIILVMIVTISWKVTLAALIPLIILIFIIYTVSQIVQKRYELNREAVSSLSSEVLEGVDGVRVIRAYSSRTGSVESFNVATTLAMKRSNDLVALNSIYGPLSSVMVGLSSAIGMIYSAYLIGQGELSVGQLVVTLIYIQMLSHTVWGFADLIPGYKQGVISFGKINELLHAKNTVELEGQTPLTQINTIAFNDYGFSFPKSSTENLSGINIRINKGQTIGIVGKTGSGKTTLVRQFLRQYPIGKQGELLINDQNIIDYKIKDVESMIGYVPQDHILFSRTVRENILVGKPKATQAELDAAIDAADLRKDLVNMPQGLDTLIGEKGVSISGGQKQRISIARALIRKADLLILDDSLSAVDAKTEINIIKNIQSYRKNQTNIIVTHRLSAVSHADFIYVIQDGRVVEEGTPHALLEQKGWYYSQHLAQQMEEEGDYENI
ncbi:ABC transporter ATP-binding protein [Fundicoccus sp. Sow4_H7]|uniref:ABC transporter ATP-binding protein n=1 Tax=Fundicoccus sp. Sow4_H7 TaxID=3438784 RepID=UPI003F911D0F